VILRRIDPVVAGLGFAGARVNGDVCGAFSGLVVARLATASESCVLRTPASTWATRLARSILRMRFILTVETTTPFS
jgi:hypothetical protein